MPRSYILILTVSPEESTDLFSKGCIPVTALSFIRQDETGNPVTSLVKDGEIIYPDYPEIEKVSFKVPDFIGLDELENFSILEIALRPEHNGIQLRLDGIAGKVSTGSTEFQKDHRLALFDILWQNKQLMVLFSIIVWVFPTTLGGYRLYKEIKK